MKVPGLHAIRTMPGQIVGGVGALAGAAGHATTAVVRAPSELLVVLDRVEDLVTRLENLLPTLEEQLDRVQGMVDFAEPLVGSSGPYARAFAENAKPEHVVSIMTMLDLLPEINVRIVPAVQNLVELTPELDLLIERFDNVAKIVQGMPGARLFQRRTEASEQPGSE